MGDPSGVRVRPGIDVALRHLRRVGGLPTALTAPPPRLAGLLVGLPGRLVGPCSADALLAAALGVGEGATSGANSAPAAARTLPPAMAAAPTAHVARFSPRVGGAPAKRPEVWSARPVVRPRLGLAEVPDPAAAPREALSPARLNKEPGARLRDFAASLTASVDAPAVMGAAPTPAHRAPPHPAGPGSAMPSGPESLVAVEVGRHAMARVGAAQPVGVVGDPAQLRVVLSRAAGTHTASRAAASPADAIGRVPAAEQVAPRSGRHRMEAPGGPELSGGGAPITVTAPLPTDRRSDAVVPAPAVRGLAGLVDAWEADRTPAEHNGHTVGRAPTTPGFDAVDVLTDLLEQVLSSEAARHGIAVPR
jgi:hypothetical protein